MPYEKEYAGYGPLRRISENPKVTELLSRSKVKVPQADTDTTVNHEPRQAPSTPELLPRFILATDGSNIEVEVESEYPGAHIGYITVASVLLDLDLLAELDVQRPINPVDFRNTEQASADDAALPGSNVVTRRQASAAASFREELYDLFGRIQIDEEGETLQDTYEQLLAAKPTVHRQRCPYQFDAGDCDHEFEQIPQGYSTCPTCERPIYSTDALRIHERFNLLGNNGEAQNYVMQVWERLFIIQLLHAFEQKNLLDKIPKIAFFVDGPLAIFGPPAWLRSPIQKELMRINEIILESTGSDIILVGVEKGGAFVEHFEDIDTNQNTVEDFYQGRDCLILTDNYIKKRIILSESNKPYGEDTYFGRKIFYKCRSGARIVATVPMLNEIQEDRDRNDHKAFPYLASVCTLLDQLVTVRYPNALMPIVAAHAEAAIPLSIGTKILQELAQALMENQS